MMKKKQFSLLIASLLVFSSCTENTSSVMISSGSSIVSSSTDKVSADSSINGYEYEFIGKTITVSSTSTNKGETVQSEGTYTYQYYPKTRTMIETSDGYAGPSESYTVTQQFDEKNRVLLYKRENQSELIFEYDYTYSGDNQDYDTKTCKSGNTTMESVTYDSSYRRLKTVWGTVGDCEEITITRSLEKTYDSYGNMLSQDIITYNSSGEKTSESYLKNEYVYDSQGQWTDKKVYDSDDNETWTLYEEYIKEYDGKGRETLSECIGAPIGTSETDTDIVEYDAHIYEEDGSCHRKYYQEGCDWVTYYTEDYNADGQILEKDYIDGYTETASFLDRFSLTPYKKEIYSYDQGMLIKKEIYELNNYSDATAGYYVSEKTEREYNDKHQLVSIKNYTASSAASPLYSYQFEYDDKGNCVKKTYQYKYQYIDQTKTYTVTFTEGYDVSLDFSNQFLEA